MSDNSAPDLTPQQRAELEVEVLGHFVHEHDAMRFISAAYDEVRVSHPHLDPGNVLRASRDAWCSVHFGFMSARRARKMIPRGAVWVAELRSKIPQAQTEP